MKKIFYFDLLILFFNWDVFFFYFGAGLFRKLYQITAAPYLNVDSPGFDW